MLSFQLTILIIIIIFIITILFIIDRRLKNLVIKVDVNNKSNYKPFSYIKDPIKNYDDRKLFDPYEAPAKRPERTQMGYLPKMKQSNNPLDPFPTRGYPDNYHLLGTLVADNQNKEIKPSHHKSGEETIGTNEETNEEQYNKLSQDNKIISLFGRQTYPGSSEYEYYTMISTGNTMTKIPIKQQRELFNDDSVYIKELKSDYKVNLYPNEALKYNPFLL